MAREGLDEHRLRRLIDVGRALVAQLDLEAVLSEVVEVGRELTGARYATLRLQEADEHPRSYGFSPERPPAHTVLDVPIVVRGQVYGNLCLSEKESGDFDEADEEAVTILAEWAAVAIFNVRLYAQSEEERGALERAVHALEATTEIARAVGGETETARVLETIAQRSRALVGARSLLVLLREGEHSNVVAAVGECGAAPIGRYVEVETETSEQALAEARRIGVEAGAALIAPLSFRGRTLGALVALDRIGEGPGFHPEDEGMLKAAAASAATAVATVQSVTEDRLRQSLATAERERARWARELHDTVLQGMGSRRLLLSSALKSGNSQRLSSAVEEGLREVGRDIDELRRLITELRPATLDQLGLVSALEDLAERVSHAGKFELEADLEVGAGQLGPELETAVYRLVQEALNNVAKHAGAECVQLQVRATADRLDLLVADDGRGFDLAKKHDGFGLAGMRERVELAGGELRIESKLGAGTQVKATVPLAVPVAAKSKEITPR